MPPKHQTKTCDRCGRAKPATDAYFGTNLRNKDRLMDHCRACRPAVLAERRQRKREQAREWAAANREKVVESRKRTYEKHREERLAYLRRWRRENREKISEYQRTYKNRRNGGEH